MSYLRKEIFNDDPVTKKRVVWHEIDRGNEWVVETKVDVTDLVESNKAAYAATDERARWGRVGEVFAKVASVDPVHWWASVKRGEFNPDDEKSLLSWIEDRDNLSWRTRPGRLI